MPLEMPRMKQIDCQWNSVGNDIFEKPGLKLLKTSRASLAAQHAADMLAGFSFCMLK